MLYTDEDAIEIACAIVCCMKTLDMSNWLSAHPIIQFLEEKSKTVVIQNI